MTKRLVTAGEVQALTGLTADQLREWTGRRGLIKPDEQPHGPGSRAKYSWQTVLILRLAVVLKESFHIELQSQRGLFASLTDRLAKRPFHALRGSALVLEASGQCDIVPLSKVRAMANDILVIRFDPHLDALSTGFELVGASAQLPLIPVASVQ
ncbi:MerR family transcriptional regulator [Burkholderia gladioli]|uniref:MerR family transcriptional regulator n=1 Tax=Burkholderia gladioli TaxID=28095 RepID=UPI001641AC61|nr:MerR family transcriptional regulator [Burkholderia gladioli]